MFGLSSDYVKCKVLGEINKMMTKFCDGNPNNDVRVVAYNDWDYSEMCKLRTRNLPYISTYGYDLSYNALMVVAKDLFDRYPVVSKEGNGIEWVVWLKKHLLTRHDEKWLSEICTHVNELEEKSLLALVQNCDVKYLPINLADNNWVLVDGYLSLSDLDGKWLLVFKSIFEDSTGKRSNYFMSADWNSQGLDTLDWWAGAIVYNSVKPKFQCLNSDYRESYISSHREAYKTYRGCTVSGKLSKLSLSRMLKICEEIGGRFIVDIEMRHKVYREKEEAPQRQTLVLDASQIMKIRKEEYTCEMPRT